MPDPGSSKIARDDMLGSLFGHLDDRLTSICAGMAILSSTQAAICGNYDAATCGPVAAKSVPLFHQTRPFFFLPFGAVRP